MFGQSIDSTRSRMMYSRQQMQNGYPVINSMLLSMTSIFVNDDEDPPWPIIVAFPPVGNNLYNN